MLSPRYVLQGADPYNHAQAQLAYTLSTLGPTPAPAPTVGITGGHSLTTLVPAPEYPPFVMPAPPQPVAACWERSGQVQTLEDEICKLPLGAVVPRPIPQPPVQRQVEPAREVPPPDDSKLRALMARLEDIDRDRANLPLWALKGPVFPSEIVMRDRQPAGYYGPVPEHDRVPYIHAMETADAAATSDLRNMLHNPRLYPSAPPQSPRPSVLEHVQSRRQALYAADMASQPSQMATSRRSGSYIPPISVNRLGYVSTGEIPYH